MSVCQCVSDTGHWRQKSEYEGRATEHTGSVTVITSQMTADVLVPAGTVRRLRTQFAPIPCSFLTVGKRKETVTIIVISKNKTTILLHDNKMVRKLVAGKDWLYYFL
jgi:hypothetical protein